MRLLHREHPNDFSQFWVKPGWSAAKTTAANCAWGIGENQTGNLLRLSKLSKQMLMQWTLRLEIYQRAWSMVNDHWSCSYIVFWSQESHACQWTSVWQVDNILVSPCGNDEYACGTSWIILCLDSQLLEEEGHCRIKFNIWDTTLLRRSNLSTHQVSNIFTTVNIR